MRVLFHLYGEIAEWTAQTLSIEWCKKLVTRVHKEWHQPDFLVSNDELDVDGHETQERVELAADD